MTQKQREDFNFLIGKLEGLTFAVADCDINAGLCEVCEEFKRFLKEDTHETD